MDTFRRIEIILYVKDQQKSADFYAKILKKLPILNVPGMTEFALSEHCILGLMPENGIATILSNTMPHPNQGNGIPRCELYLTVEEIETEFENAVIHGAKIVSPIKERNWGDCACYLADPDGHIIAFAQPLRI